MLVLVLKLVKSLVPLGEKKLVAKRPCCGKVRATAENLDECVMGQIGPSIGADVTGMGGGGVSERQEVNITLPEEQEDFHCYLR